METKKAFDADLENEKSSMFLMGLLIALCASFIVLEWSNKDAKHFTIKDMMPTAIIETDPVPITTSTPPPPPPVIEEPQITDPVFKKDEKADTKTTPITGELDPTKETPDASILTKPIEIVRETDPDDNIIWDYKKVDKTAKYNGNLRADLSKNLVYPKAALEAGITGTVLIRFTVNKDGTIEDITVIREIDPILSREAVRVVKLLNNWEPAEKGGKKVRSVFQLPVNFSLNR
ncbi:MAG: energy transducer TonB [Paludibacteraceae bacterium]|nr:energy transducer TonB [Paludibacteraceae bacterium]